MIKQENGDNCQSYNDRDIKALRSSYGAGKCFVSVFRTDDRTKSEAR